MMRDVYAEEIAAALSAHLPIRDGISTEYFGPRMMWIKCSCKKWKSSTAEGWRDRSSEQQAEHRAHVAEVIAAQTRAESDHLLARLAEYDRR